jgi:hypothetical protein
MTDSAMMGDSTMGDSTGTARGDAAESRSRYVWFLVLVALGIAAFLLWFIVNGVDET